MNTLSKMQEELMQEKQVKKSLGHHLHKMREKQQQLEEEGECVRIMEYENQRIHRELDAQSQMLSKLKDEQYELSMRYSHALQEKDAVQSRNSDLQEQVRTNRIIIITIIYSYIYVFDGLLLYSKLCGSLYYAIDKKRQKISGLIY